MMTFFFTVCEQAPSIPNGEIVNDFGSATSYAVNDTISYKCNDGFAAENTSVLTNMCIEDVSGTDPPTWLQNETTLSQICRPSNH